MGAHHAYTVLAQIENRQEREWIRFIAFDLDRRAQKGLRKNQVRQSRQIEERCINIEELPQQSFETMEVMFRLRIEPFKFDVKRI